MGQMRIAPVDKDFHRYIWCFGKRTVSFCYLCMLFVFVYLLFSFKRCTGDLHKEGERFDKV